VGGDFCILEPQRIFLCQVSFKGIQLEYETLRTGYSHAADLKVGHMSCFAAMSTDRMKREVLLTALQISRHRCKVHIDGHPQVTSSPTGFDSILIGVRSLGILEG